MKRWVSLDQGCSLSLPEPLVTQVFQYKKQTHQFVFLIFRKLNVEFLITFQCRTWNYDLNDLQDHLQKWEGNISVENLKCLSLGLEGGLSSPLGGFIPRAAQRRSSCFFGKIFNRTASVSYLIPPAPLVILLCP